MSAFPGSNVRFAKNPGDWFAGKYGPFCSQRCKLIDLGKWLGEEHAIFEPLRPEHFNKTEQA